MDDIELIIRHTLDINNVDESFLGQGLVTETIQSVKNGAEEV